MSTSEHINELYEITVKKGNIVECEICGCLIWENYNNLVDAKLMDDGTHKWTKKVYKCKLCRDGK